MEGKLHAVVLGERNEMGLNGSTREQGPSKEKFIRAIVSTLRTYPKGYATEQELLADLFDDHQIDAMAETRKLRYDRFRNFLRSDECANYVRCMEKSNGKMVYQALDGKCSLPGSAAKVEGEKDKTVIEKLNALNMYDGNLKAGDKSDSHRDAYSDQKKLSLLTTDDDEQPGEEIDSNVSNNSCSIPPEWFITPSKHQQAEQAGGGNGSGGEVVKRRDPYMTIQDVAWHNYRDKQGGSAEKMIDRTEEPIIAMKPMTGHVVKEKGHNAKLAMVICSIVEYSYPRYLLLDDLLAALKYIDPRSSFLDGSCIDEFLTAHCQQVKVVSEGSHKHLIWTIDH